MRLKSKIGIYVVTLLIFSGTITADDGVIDQHSAKNSVTISEENENEGNAEERAFSAETNLISTEMEHDKRKKDFLSDIPEFSGVPYVELNGNLPEFDLNEIVTNESFEIYSELDSLGRCGTAYANVGVETMPTESRGSIGNIRPSGWHTVKYSDVIEDNYLYNRCHLIAFQLAGENANEKNLITGTRYLNIEGMFPFENMVATYVNETSNHVLYRVTPIFHGENLVASGVQMEAWSVEDDGKGICFNIYCYNVQPNIYIDYLTGDSRINEEPEQEVSDKEVNVKTSEIQLECDYILNENTRKIHLPTCASVGDILEKNIREYHGTIEILLENGYTPCQVCIGENRKD